MSTSALLQGQKLSEKEQRELEYKRQVYELAKLRKQQQEELDKRDEYHMPTAYDAEGQNQSKRYEVLTARYRSASPPQHVHDTDLHILQHLMSTAVPPCKSRFDRAGPWLSGGVAGLHIKQHIQQQAVFLCRLMIVS